ncbi:hypothetical protein [Aliarcobacter butzleri]|uniref:Uncharacterized protein n=1 Tax=Aliarcobacter butzleri TaxID=28197 RepID=A0AAP4PY92_9BACT|nr:hypothetical protein [Aliarcobacter butzleri]MCG3705029.1 hypothetical protein [Aliarcobacter butzleri]MDN5051603.1 hypothetical protein [Aliarcobacter butzleri]MDN5074914.1 hypothetical protein [Aliarcobacter butzleri]MDN5115742.1 hypothetical protein [Aliarcobacter butzleri]MDN5131519.1 hypothetical protein [Aliarcobacter butzleri]
MKQKTIKSEVFEINTSSLSKTQKNIYNEIYQKYRLSEIYEFLKLIYKCEVNFSDIFMKDFFTILIKTDEYTSKVKSVYYYTYFPKNDDCSLIEAVYPLNCAICRIMEAIILKKFVLTEFELEKLIFASLIIFLDKSFYYCRFQYPSKLNKYIEDESINEYVNAINSKNDSFEFIWNLIKTELKNEAEILDNNKRLFQVLNNKKLL